MKTCLKENCGKPITARGLCNSHYRRQRYAEQRDYATHSKWVAAHPESGRTARAKYRQRNPARIMWYNARRRAAHLGLSFDISITDIKIPAVCPVLGVPLTVGHGAPTPSSPSLDRVMPEFGYVKGNIQVISQRANRIKNDATLDEIEKLYKWMLLQQPTIQ